MRAKQIKHVDERIDALKLSTLMPQVKYNIILKVNFEKTTRLNLFLKGVYILTIRKIITTKIGT